MSVCSFLAAVPEPARSRLKRASGLEQILRQLTASARATWPGVDLSEDQFWPLLARRVPANATSITELLSIKIEDFYLATGCARNDAAALAAFEKTYLQELEHRLAARLHNSVSPDELLQLVRLKLLLPQGQSPPRIASYSGSGSLRHWVRMIALRIVVDVHRSRRRCPEQLSSELAHCAGATLDPELELIRASCRAQFQAALAEAVAALDLRSRRLLRQHYLGGLTLEQIAKVTKLHRVTVARQLARARARLLKATRIALKRRLHLTPAELQSLVAAAISRLDVSMATLLKTCDTP